MLCLATSNSTMWTGPNFISCLRSQTPDIVGVYDFKFNLGSVFSTIVRTWRTLEISNLEALSFSLTLKNDFRSIARYEVITHYWERKCLRGTWSGILSYYLDYLERKFRKHVCPSIKQPPWVPPINSCPYISHGTCPSPNLILWKFVIVEIGIFNLCVTGESIQSNDIFRLCHG